MKKIVLALVVAVVACVVVFASQDVKCRQAAVYSSFEQVTPDGFRRIDMQNPPHMPYYGQWEPLLLMRVVLLKELI